MQHTAVKWAELETGILAAVKLPISEKWVLKMPFLGTSPSGSALFSQRLRRGAENCKTFMRRFDPGPRLQLLRTPAPQPTFYTSCKQSRGRPFALMESRTRHD